MERLIIFIKTYKPDFERVSKLIASIELYNVENIPVVISVNDQDFEFFKDHLITSFKIIKDSDIIPTTITDPWKYQQIIKSNVYRLNICKNYLCVDSDSEFIRNFYYSDFMFDDETPYTIMHESKSFLEDVEKIGEDSEKIFFKEALREIRPFFGNKGKEWDYGPSPYLWSCKVWEHLNNNYLQKENLSFEEFFNQIDKKTPPSECVIYGEYLLKTKLIAIYPVEGFFKVYHFDKQFEMEKKYYNLEKLKKIYLGVIFQSNWNQKKSFFNFKLFSR